MSFLHIYLKHAESLPKAEVRYREDWGCYYCSVMNKCFALMTDEQVTLKGDPEANIALRELYADVSAGYHTNKKHWNSIKTETTELSTNEVEKMIDKSYELVCQKLTKKEQQLLHLEET